MEKKLYLYSIILSTKYAHTPKQFFRTAVRFKYLGVENHKLGKLIFYLSN